MKSQKEVWRNLKWDKVKESREKYYVIYKPIRKVGVNYASLDLYFISNFKNEEIANVMENELEIWINRYPVPTIIFPTDKSDNDILLGNVRSGDFLLGYLDHDSKGIVNVLGDSEELIYSEAINDITDKELIQIYNGLGYKTIKQVEQELYKKYNNRYKVNKFINSIVKAGLFIGIVVETVTLNSLWLGLYFYLKEIIKFIAKLSGYKTKKKIKNRKKKADMEHYYYHCNKNPSGFLKLKQENIEKESRERIKKQSEELKNFK